MRKRKVAGWLLLAALMLAGVLVVLDGDIQGLASGRAEGESQRHEALSAAALEQAGQGIAYFAFGDFSALSTDTLRTSAAPWVVTSTLLALQETGGDPEQVTPAHVEAALRRFGFLYPEAIGNWPLSTLPAAQPGQPLGQNLGQAERRLPPVSVTVANFGCSACHAGVMYGLSGQPDPRRAWLGTPNTSLYLAAYTRGLYRAMRDHGRDDARLWAAVDRLHPQLGLRERLTLRYFVLPELRRQLDELETAGAEDLLPFVSGRPGATNGYDSLRNRLGLIAAGEQPTPSVLNSIPELGGRVLRNRLLSTGVYQIPGKRNASTLTHADLDEAHLHDLGAIAAYFTVPSMGVTAEVAASHIDDTTQIMRWLRDYRPQPFPGRIDRARAAQGRAVYAARCAGCHGRYDDSLQRPQLLAFPNWQGDVGSDRVRANQFTSQVAAVINASSYGRHLNVDVSRSYSAPPLAGLWSSAPYLHNGSVPTLWQLMTPDQRACEFPVGGHALDFAQMGLALDCDAQRRCRYLVGYRPFSMPAVFDTRQPGMGNGGHEREFEGLDESGKLALIEYLKLL